MDKLPIEQDPARAAAVETLRAPELADALAPAGPTLVLAAEPPRLVLATPAALALFGARDEESLALRLAAGQEPAFARLLQLTRSLRPGAPPRREQWVVGGQPIPFSLRRLAGRPALLVAVAPQVGAPVVAPSEPAAPIPPEAPGFPQEPAPALDPRSQEEVRADLARRFGGAPVVRFLWQTDAQDRIVALSGPLAEIARLDESALLGSSLVAAARGAGARPVEPLAEALATRQTWSQLELAWPVYGAEAAVCLVLGGAPIRQGSDFAGYRGFGVIHLQKVLPHPTAGSAPEAAGDGEQNRASPGPEAQEGRSGPGPDAETSAPAPAETPAAGTNVVQLRPNRAAAAMIELSPSERNAFREIARALGARPDSAAQPSGRPGPKPSEPASREAEAPEPPAGASVIPSNPRVRDLIEIASRARSLAEEMSRDMPAPPSPAEEAPAEEAEAPDVPERAPVESVQTGLGEEARVLFDRLPIGLLISRLEIPIFLNRTLLDLLDYRTADEFYEAGGLEAMFRGRSPELLAEGAAGGAIPVVTRAGEVLAVEARVQAVTWEGDPATMICLRPSREGESLARLRASEQDLRGREAELRELHAILDTATDGVALIDDDGKLLSMNRAAQALFGYEPNELLGEPFTMLFVRESHHVATDYLAGLRSSGVASVLNDGREVLGRARQGGSIPLFMTLGRVTAGGSNKFCMVLRDITSWKKAERELEEARRQAERASALKSDFLAKVSHEIRTPLNAILGFAEVIMEERFGPVGNERYKDYLKDIHASGTHVMSLVNDLLDLSKIEAGRMELNFGAVDANKIVAECVSLMQPQAARERVIIRTSLAQHLPNIVADERSLRQIVLNLLSNAVKYNEPGGQVIVSTALTDAGHAVIRIRDTGIGMTETEAQIAMEPFRQLATARVSGGTGLGLPLTKALVEANRASFTIKSKKKEGTLIEVAFPPTRVLAE